VAPKTVKVLSREYSLMDPKHYLRLIYIDVLGFIVQAVGIVVAFTDISAETGWIPDENMGSEILAAGAALHVVSLTCFMTLFGIVLVQAWIGYRKSQHSTFLVHVSLPFKFKIFLVVLVGATVCLWSRGIYTTFILASGFQTGVARNEIPYTGFEGLLTSQAVIALLAVHPVVYLDESFERKMESEKGAFSARHPWDICVAKFECYLIAIMNCVCVMRYAY
jgi:hypothetical protein